MPQQEVIKIIKWNIKPSLVTLIFVIKVDSMSDLKAEYKRVEKFLRKNRQKSGHVNGVNCYDQTNNFNKKANQAIKANWSQNMFN